jgi:hypothetical protein
MLTMPLWSESTGSGLLDGQPNDFARKLLRLASRTGKSRLVLMAADLPITACQGGTDENDLKQLEAFLLTEAVAALRILRKRRSEKASEREEIPRMIPDESVQYVFDGLRGVGHCNPDEKPEEP